MSPWRNFLKNRGRFPKMVVCVTQVHFLSHKSHLQLIVKPAEWEVPRLKNMLSFIIALLVWHYPTTPDTVFTAFNLPFSDSRIEKRSLIAWVCANQKQQVSFFNASNPSIKEIVWTQISSEKANIKAVKGTTVLNSLVLSSVLFILWSYPAPAIGNASSVHRVSLLKRFSKSFREMSASASTKPPTTAATSFPSTPCSCQRKHLYKQGSGLPYVYLSIYTVKKNLI